MNNSIRLGGQDPLAISAREAVNSVIRRFGRVLHSVNIRPKANSSKPFNLPSSAVFTHKTAAIYKTNNWTRFLLPGEWESSSSLDLSAVGPAKFRPMFLGHVERKFSAIVKLLAAHLTFDRFIFFLFVAIKA